MTDKPTPTDAEILDAAEDFRSQYTHGGTTFDEFDEIGFTRAVLAKWGQPAQAGEPFCWHWENTFNGGTGTVKKNPETLGINMVHPDHKWTALYTAPQPTQTQPVAREPLPKFLALKFYARRDKKATVTLLFPGHEAADAWVRGIKGGQHGAK